MFVSLVIFKKPFWLYYSRYMNNIGLFIAAHHHPIMIPVILRFSYALMLVPTRAAVSHWAPLLWFCLWSAVVCDYVTSKALSKFHENWMFSHVYRNIFLNLFLLLFPHPCIDRWQMFGPLNTVCCLNEAVLHMRCLQVYLGIQFILFRMLLPGLLSVDSEVNLLT